MPLLSFDICGVPNSAAPLPKKPSEGTFHAKTPLIERGGKDKHLPSLQISMKMYSVACLGSIIQNADVPKIPQITGVNPKEIEQWMEQIEQ